jgi:hypothetical protein
MTYLMVVVGTLYFSELSVGKIRFFTRLLAFVGLAIAVAAVGLFFWTGSNNRLIPYNNLLAVCVLLAWMIVVAVPKFSNKYLILPVRGVLAVGTLLFAIEALYNNLLWPLGLKLCKKTLPVRNSNRTGYPPLMELWGRDAAVSSKTFRA